MKRLIIVQMLICISGFVLSQSVFNGTSGTNISGNSPVGVNTTSPQAPLHVEGSQPALDQDVEIARFNTPTDPQNATNFSRFIRLGNSNIGSHYVASPGYHWGTYIAPYDYNFSANINSTNTQPVFYFSNGPYYANNFGIGTAFPVGALHIDRKNDFAGSNFIRLESTGSGFTNGMNAITFKHNENGSNYQGVVNFYFSRDANNLPYNEGIVLGRGLANTGLFVGSSINRVGVNTFSPTATFHIGSNYPSTEVMRVEGVLNDNQSTKVMMLDDNSNVKWRDVNTIGSGSSSGWSIIGNTNTSTATGNFLGTRNNEPLRIFTNWTAAGNPTAADIPALIVGANKNVGINTTVPADLLHIYRATSGRSIQIQSISNLATSSSVNNQISFVTTNGGTNVYTSSISHLLQRGTSTTVRSGIYIGTENSSATPVNGLYIATSLSAGTSVPNAYVGIATTAPSTALHVEGSGVYSNLFNTGVGTSSVRFRNLQSYSNSPHPTFLYIDDNGYVFRGADITGSSGCSNGGWWNNANTNDLATGYVGACRTGSVGIGTSNVTPGFFAPGITKLYVSNEVGAVDATGTASFAQAQLRSIGVIGFSRLVSTNLGANRSSIGVLGAAWSTTCQFRSASIYGAPPTFPIPNACGLQTAATGMSWAGYFAGAIFTTQTFSVSDSVLKTNIQNISNADSVLNALAPKTFYFKQNVEPGFSLPVSKQYGFIAQQLETILPDLVVNASSPIRIDSATNLISTDTTTYKAINYEGLIALLVKASQEQSAKIASLQAQIDACCNAAKNSSTSVTPGDKTPTQTIILENNIQQVVLYQNVPNPFSEKTTIVYQVPANAKDAEMRFYNTEGYLIKSAQLVNKGKASIEVYGSGIAAGIYTYVLYVDGKVIANKKMVKQ